MPLILIIIILLVISFLWALLSLRELKTPRFMGENIKSQLRKGRVLFYDTSSAGVSSEPSSFVSSSSSKSSSRATSGLSSSAKASSRTNG